MTMDRPRAGVVAAETARAGAGAGVEAITDDGTVGEETAVGGGAALAMVVPPGLGGWGLGALGLLDSSGRGRDWLSTSLICCLAG